MNVDSIYASSGMKCPDTPSQNSDAESRASARGKGGRQSTMGIIDEFEDEDLMSPKLGRLTSYN